jgi:hypothetical protein
MKEGCLKGYRRFWRREACGDRVLSLNVQSLNVTVVRDAASAKSALKGLYATNAAKRRGVLGHEDTVKDVVSVKGDGTARTVAAKRNVMNVLVSQAESVRIARSFLHAVLWRVRYSLLIACLLACTNTSFSLLRPKNPSAPRRL